MFLIPRPPSNLGLHTSTQLTQANLFLSPSPPHKKFLNKLSSTRTTFLGTLKKDMKYIDMEDSIDRIRQILPPKDKSLCCHPLSFRLIFDMIGFQVSTLL
ncbi:hypothetical protein JHK82_034688 [Glycine max]|nr:hypothetical protein JHK86_034759 [Glycine max]KAG5120268.1 hypothetical protein JHK82_034688 [Glycine max]